MLDRIALGPLVKMLPKGLDGHTVKLAQDRGDFLDARMAVYLSGNVKLDSVACGKQHRLALRESLPERLDRPPLLLGTEREPLAHFKRCSGVIQSQEHQSLHTCSLARSQSAPPGNASTTITTPIIRTNPTILSSAARRPRKLGFIGEWSTTA